MFVRQKGANPVSILKQLDYELEISIQNYRLIVLLVALRI